MHSMYFKFEVTLDLKRHIRFQSLDLKQRRMERIKNRENLSDRF